MFELKNHITLIYHKEKSEIDGHIVDKSVVWLFCNGLGHQKVKDKFTLESKAKNL